MMQWASGTGTTLSGTDTHWQCGTGTDTSQSGTGTSQSGTGTSQSGTGTSQSGIGTTAFSNLNLAYFCTVKFCIRT